MSFSTILKHLLSLTFPLSFHRKESLLHSLSPAIATASWLLPLVSLEMFPYRNKFGHMIFLLKNLDPMFFFILFSYTVYSRHTKLPPISAHFKVFYDSLFLYSCFICLLFFQCFPKILLLKKIYNSMCSFQKF